MRRGVIVSVIVGLSVIALSTARDKGTTTARDKGTNCPSQDVREMLREAGQGFNGSVIEIHEDRLVIEA
jgi:hypothetical protein